MKKGRICATLPSPLPPSHGLLPNWEGEEEGGRVWEGGRGGGRARPTHERDEAGGTTWGGGGPRPKRAKKDEGTPTAAGGAETERSEGEAPERGRQRQAAKRQDRGRSNAKNQEGGVFSITAKNESVRPRNPYASISCHATASPSIAPLTS